MIGLHWRKEPQRHSEIYSRSATGTGSAISKRRSKREVDSRLAIYHQTALTMQAVLGVVTQVMALGETEKMHSQSLPISTSRILVRVDLPAETLKE